MKLRLATLFLVSLLACAQLTAFNKAAWAEDGGGSGGGGGGSGGGNDDGGGDDNGGGNDDGGDDDSSGSSGSSQSASGGLQDAVRHGKAVSLSKLMKFINSNYDGKVINVEFKKTGTSYIYKVKILTSDNKLKIIVLNAQNLAPANSAVIY